MREGKKWILTNQKIDSENILYEWVSEPGACKVCQEMDGKVYESANDIPDRPHPNCLEIQAFTESVVSVHMGRSFQSAPPDFAVSVTLN